MYNLKLQFIIDINREMYEFAYKKKLIIIKFAQRTFFLNFKQEIIYFNYNCHVIVSLLQNFKLQNANKRSTKKNKSSKNLDV